MKTIRLQNNKQNRLQKFLLGEVKAAQAFKTQTDEILNK